MERNRTTLDILSSVVVNKLFNNILSDAIVDKSWNIYDAAMYGIDKSTRSVFVEGIYERKKKIRSEIINNISQTFDLISNGSLTEASESVMNYVYNSDAFMNKYYNNLRPILDELKKYNEIYKNLWCDYNDICMHDRYGHDIIELNNNLTPSSDRELMIETVNGKDKKA